MAGVHDIGSFTRSLDRCGRVRTTTVSSSSLSINGVDVSIHVGDECCCAILSSGYNYRVGGRGSLVSIIDRLSGVGAGFSGFGSTLNRIRQANCNVIVPSVSRLALRRPRVIGRNKQCNIGLGTRTPSVRVVHYGAHARMTPVINDRDRSRRLIVCLLHRFRRGPTGV